MTMTKEMEKTIVSAIDEKTAHKEHTFTTVIDGQEVEYTRQHFFQEIENKATYKGDKYGYLYIDGDTQKAAFTKLAELRGVTADTAYHWICDIATEMVEDYRMPADQGGFPDLATVYECEGPIHLMQQIEKMSSLFFDIVLSEKE